MDTSTGPMTGQDLSKQDLRNADLTGQILFGTNLRGAKLDGARISLSCETFSGVQLDSTQVATLLLLLSQADIEDAWEVAIENAVKSVIGLRACAFLQGKLNLI